MRQGERYAGGGESHLNNLVSELANRGHEVHVFTQEHNQGELPPNVILHRVPVPMKAAAVAPLFFARRCKKATTAQPFDVVYSLQRTTLRQDLIRAGDGCHREWMNRRFKYATPLKRCTMWLNPANPAQLWLERQAFSPRNTGFVIANSKRGRDEIVGLYGFPPERMRVIYNGVDGERFRPLPSERSRDKYVMLFVGRGFERKGLKFCVQALAHLPENVCLRVVGKGNRRPYHRLAGELGVNSRLSFENATPRIEEVYPQAHLLIHPAIYEPFGNVCLEAMACGLPVVTSAFNGVSEILTPGVNGAVVEDLTDTSALAQAVRPFLDQSVLARASIEARCTAQSMPVSLNVDATLAVIEELFHSRAGIPA